MTFHREWNVLIHNMCHPYGKAVLKPRGIPIYLFKKGTHESKSALGGKVGCEAKKMAQEVMLLATKA